MNINVLQIKTNFSGNTCYTHARAAIMPNGNAVMTTQPLRLSGSDIFYGMENLFSYDHGKTWTQPAKSKTIVRQDLGNGVQVAFCDATPFYHKHTNTLLLTGHSAWYLNDELYPSPRPRQTLWTTFNNDTNDWNPSQTLIMPDEDAFFSCGAGCTQIHELPDGNLLVPVYFMNREMAKNPWQATMLTMVMKCAFDGNDLRVIECGTPISSPVPRGLYEPSIVAYGNAYYLTMRNDVKGFIAKSSDGLHYDEPVVLAFDDGQESGNYNTQQHWIVGNNTLYLVYTRKGANNDHVFRHRAPLFIAQFDTDTMKLVRSTERIAVPERGARLGNFGCIHVNDNESWVVVSEWMQTTGPDSGNWKRCMSYGSDNSIFVSQITW